MAQLNQYQTEYWCPFEHKTLCAVCFLNLDQSSHSIMELSSVRRRKKCWARCNGIKLAFWCPCRESEPELTGGQLLIKNALAAVRSAEMQSRWNRPSWNSISSSFFLLATCEVYWDRSLGNSVPERWTARSRYPSVLAKWGFFSLLRKL